MMQFCCIINFSYRNCRSNEPQEKLWKRCFATLSKFFLVWVWAQSAVRFSFCKALYL